MWELNQDAIHNKNLKILSEAETFSISTYMLEYINYRKTGLSLNHIIGCPLNCGYCVRHFWGNFDDKYPKMICDDDTAIGNLLKHKYFIADKTPLQLFNKATDPFLPSVKEHTFYILKKLDNNGLKNIVTLITRYKVTKEDIIFLEKFQNIKIVLYFTYSGIKNSQIEPIQKTEITVNSIKIANKYKNKTKVILYWRPLVLGWNDDEQTMREVLKLGSLCNAIVFTGYYNRKENASYFESIGIKAPYNSFERRKIMPYELEQKILKIYRESKIKTPLFRKTSCGASYVHSMPDYNGHWGVNELCDICPSEQKSICNNSYNRPDINELNRVMNNLNYESPILIEDGHIWTEGLGEEMRYYIQHLFGYQIWDVRLPHFKNYHGRSNHGYNKTNDQKKWYSKKLEEFKQGVIEEDD